MRRLDILCLAAAAYFAFAGIAPADGRAQGDGVPMLVHSHSDAMMAQHRAMDTIQKEWTLAKGALDEGRPLAAVGPVKAMERAAERIESFMLHKNPGGREEFSKQARDFKDLLSAFRQLLQASGAKDYDSERVRNTVMEVDRACDDCHHTFR